MVNVLKSGFGEGEGGWCISFETWPGHCVVFFGKTLYFHRVSITPPMSVNWFWKIVREA